MVAVVGTDHHPFDRLVGWIDAAARRHPEHRFFVQHGASGAPVVAEGAPYLGHAALTAMLGEAAVMVCHGGPGTIMDARAQRLVPICVPRDPERGEHVDGHQLRFAAAAEHDGLVRRVLSAEEFERTLATALTDDPEPHEGPVGTDPAVGAARERASQTLDSLMVGPARRRDLLRRVRGRG